MTESRGRNPAIVLGASRRIGLDIDGDEGYRLLREVAGRLVRTITVKTGTGAHLYYDPPPGSIAHPAVFEFGPNGVTARSNAYLVAPPAVHPSGRIYRFQEGCGPGEIEIAALPMEALEAMLRAAGRRSRSLDGLQKRHDDLATDAARIPYPGRNNALTSLAGRMRRAGLEPPEILAALQRVNEDRCEPDEFGNRLRDDELLGIARSAERWPGPRGSASGHAHTGHAVEITAAEIAAEPIQWLWSWHLALGKLTLLDGAPDVGKTLVLIDLAARVSRGADMPDGTPGLGGPRDVIVIAAFEDALNDTWVPRLVAAGGDRSRVTFLKGVAEDAHTRPLSFPGDLELLEARIGEHDAALVLCDAVMHLLPDKANQNDTKEVQRGLHPFVDMLARTGAAMIANRHYTKGSGRTALDKGQGSASLIGVAGWRSVWCAIRPRPTAGACSGSPRATSSPTPSAPRSGCGSPKCLT